MQTDTPKSTRRSSAVAAPGGAWVWSHEAHGFVVVTPASFPLHVIAETDPRLHALARGERVEVDAPVFLLWEPDFVQDERIRHRGFVAAAFDAGTSDRAPDLWLEAKPYVFLRAGDAEPPAWLVGYQSGRAAWLTYDGATLHALRGVGFDRDGRIIVDLERVAG